MRAIAAALLVLTLAPPTSEPLAAQAVMGARVGMAGGRHGGWNAEINGRVRLSDTWRLVGSAEGVGSTSVDILPAWPESYRKDYWGWSLMAGAAAAAVDNDRAYFAFRFSGGLFVRYSGEFEGRLADIWGAGVDTELRLSGPLRLQGGLGIRWIGDETYRDLFGQWPYYTTVSIGASIVLGAYGGR